MRFTNKSATADSIALYSTFFIWIARITTVVLFPFFHPFQSFGKKHVPPSGPVILAPNHVSYLDPIEITRPLRRRVFYLAWDQLFKNPIFGGIIRKMGAVPLNTERRSDLSAYRTAIEILKHDEVLTIFPEGARGLDGDLQELQRGVARIAVRSHCPIVPVWIEGTFRAWPANQRFPRPFVPVSVTYMPPLYPRPAQNRQEEKKEVERLTEALRESLLKACQVARHRQ